MRQSHTIIECKNHFKNGSDEPLKNSFVLKWIEMINKLEKNISIVMTNQ